MKIMLNKLALIPKTYISLVVAVVVLAVPAPTALQAATADVCEGVGLASGQAGCGTDASPQINNAIATAVNIVSVMVGIAAVIMIIIGGFKYITSGGDSSNISSAKNTILYAVVGLIIVALAQVIVRFVVARVTNTEASPEP